MSLSTFYPIVDSANWIERIVPLGAKQIQLRIKEASSAQLKAEIIAAQQICQDHNCDLIINDHWALALELGCDYIHLGQEDLQAADLDIITRSGVRLGISSHDETELQTALDLNPTYIALGPVYPTILKKMKWAPQGLSRVTQWKKAVGDIPLVAIGGMKAELAPSVLAAGADSVAVVTDILLHDNPEQRVKQWLTATGETV
ncbi:thiamine phosphate synthase [Pseudoalteromonas sp. SMS1]|uniref:thiamine phosphate synthase n=1 Tax=Pseudoalteromonas sp. SMS1 TaxID=2908894 RepID=UPI001F35B9AC|nr:thiamine phosphate synthase [Pseudoalteromonas sp. SMS1]MCF2858489.1 thiamine phosphate synthase [Pseudoalteromonas sp. SMS1]